MSAQVVMPERLLKADMVTASDANNPQSPSNAARAAALAEILVARLCHDLAGLVGSLAGALELAAEDPEALAVAQSSAIALQARLRLLRTAFGPSETALSRADLHALFSMIALPRRVALHLAFPNDEVAMPGTFAQLLLVLGMLGVESLAGEGHLVLEAAGPGEFVLSISGPRAAWPSGLITYLTDPDSALASAPVQGPRGVLAPLAGLLAGLAGISVQALLGAHDEKPLPLLISER